MKRLEVVIDTNVLVSALKSKRGASFKLLTLIGQNKFDINLSVPLILEYEDVVKRLVEETALNEEDINDILDYFCSVSNRREIFYL